MEGKEISIPVGPDAQLAATCWTVPGAKGVVIIHPATAVNQGFYAAFAGYLASRGLNVLTYDYRGTGRSLSSDLRQVKVTMADWIDADVPAAMRWAEAAYPGLPLVAVGHSVGGHAIALSPDSSRLRAAMLVASHAGATRLVRGWFERQRVRFVLRVLTPILCRLLGYMPGSRLGLGEDLPASVMLQWAGWTARPRYFFDDPEVGAARRMAQLRIPLRVLGFDDDPWANPAAVGLLVSHLTAARLERRQVAPRDAGVPAIGHMGFFRRRCEPGLGRETADWLLAHCAVHEAAHA
jgi:predicted alpha/beta hydrolase